jgi:hypothetical protein
LYRKKYEAYNTSLFHVSIEEAYTATSGLLSTVYATYNFEYANNKCLDLEKVSFTSTATSNRVTTTTTCN